MKKVLNKLMDFVNAYFAVLIIMSILAIGFSIIGGGIAYLLNDTNEALAFGKLMFSIVMCVGIGLGIPISFAIAVNNDNVGIKSTLTGRSAI